MTSMTPTACSEHELIAAARGGEDRAFEELYARYRGRIGAFISGRVGDHGRAEDIAQEVFISALRRLRCSRQPIQFKPWIYEIAKNACVDEYRRAARACEVSLDVEPDAGGPRPPLSLAPTPPAAVENKQRLDDLRGAFGGLSDSHHQLLVLRELEGLSYEQIAARTGMSRQMVESALFRARRKLTEEYNELASGRRCQQVQAAIQSGRALTLRTLGVKERRRFARHLAHCQPCRMEANLAGVDKSLVKPRRVGAKIAALLPFGLGRWPWGGARAARRAAGTHPSALHSLQGAAVLGEPAGASALGGAAVAAAVLALTGAGAGLAPGGAGHHPVRPAGQPSPLGPARSAPSSPSPSLAVPRGAFPRLRVGGLGSSLPSRGGARITPARRAVTRRATPGGHPQRPTTVPASPAPGAPASTTPATPAGLPGVNPSNRPGGAPALPGPAKTAGNTLGAAASSTIHAVTKVVASPPLPGAAGPPLGASQAAGGAAGAVTGAAPPAVSSPASTAGSAAGAVTSTAQPVLKLVTG